MGGVGRLVHDHRLRRGLVTSRYGGLVYVFQGGGLVQVPVGVVSGSVQKVGVEVYVQGGGLVHVEVTGCLVT